MRALVLEGGGAKGAYQIGAWQALRQRGETFDIVTGTSIGALNGALIVQGNFDLAYDLWYNISPDQIVNGNPDLLEKLVNMQVNPQDFRKVISYLKKVVGEKGLDISPLEALLQKSIQEQAVRSSTTRLGIVTVSLSKTLADLKPLELNIQDIPQGMLHQYLLASANLPVFKVNRVKGQLYIDGGFYDNLPIALAKSMGATEFTTIEIGGIGVKRVPKDIQRRIIAPKVDLGPMLGMTATQARQNLKIGYFDTLKVLDNLKGTHYYIDDDVDNEVFLQKLVLLDVKALGELAVILGAEGTDVRRFTFEKLIPKVGEILGIDSKAPYEDILIGLLEAIADDLGCDRLQVRTLSGFAAEVHKAYGLAATSNPGVFRDQLNLLDKLLLQTSVLGQSQRIALLRTVYEKLLFPLQIQL